MAEPAKSTAMPDDREDQQLAQALLRRGFITAEQLEKARAVQADRGLSLWRALLSLNYVTPQQIASAMGRGGALAGEPAPGGLPTVRVGRSAEAVRAELAKAAETRSAPELVQQIIDGAFDTRTTDIHFDPQEDGLHVRFRVDGQLHDVVTLRPELAPPVLSRIKILANMDIVERRTPQDGHINMPGREHPHDLRVATVPTSLGERMVIRVLDTSAVLTGMDQLGLEPKQIETLQHMVDRPYGMILVSGPVGSGKTTTLYSCLHRVNVPSKNCMTIEDPVEYRMKGVNQIQVDAKNDFTFASGLRALLRQDPDVIMIGEIRDDETASIGIRAALTGVLVFSSIHASDAASVIGNLYNYKIPGFLISNALLGVVSQRLVRRVCPYCKESFEPDEATLKLLAVKPEQTPKPELFRGRGCSNCFETGFLGRTGVFEIMEMNEILRDLVFRQTTKEVIGQVAIDEGMQPLKTSAINKVLDGTTTVQEMLRAVLA